MNKKAISIIVPVYNVEPYILKCLQSINAQTFKNFNLIIIDDCGKDNSLEIARSFLSRSAISYLIIQNEQNVGVSESRNIGIDAASSEYILFVDPDDWIETTMIEELYMAATKFDADIVSCGGWEIWEKDKSLKEITTVKKGSYPPLTYLKYLFNWETPAYFWLRLFKKKLFTDTRFHKDLIFEDVLLLPYIIEKSNKVIQLEAPLYNYVRHNNSITLSKPQNVREFVEALKKLDANFSDKLEAVLIAKYGYSLLFFFILSLFKYSESYGCIERDIRKITKYTTLTNLFKLRAKTTKTIWFFALLAKFNGRFCFYVFKKHQAYKERKISPL